MFGKLLEWILPHLYKNIFPRELDPVGFKVFLNHDFFDQIIGYSMSPLGGWRGGSEIPDPR